ncbi:MAG: AAA family ATPase, partial [Clostridia bacterium]|nr:AAA family ATPase [Clostridia bacterium]
MKLISCYVSSFGTLKDFSYDFTGGLNVVKEENGWGKSTFAAFIKAMFYGLDDAKRGIEDNERKRFAPWNSTDKFGGNLVFEWKGQNFKIERFFGAKSSDDTVKLYDLATNKVYTEGSAVDNIGKRVFS